MITGISHVNIKVRDYKDAMEFYTKKLGMTLTTNDLSIDHYEVAAAGTKNPGICFCLDEKDTGIIFSTNDIQATYEMLKKNGVRVTVPYKAHGEWWAGFKDMDGNSYGLHQI